MNHKVSVTAAIYSAKIFKEDASELLDLLMPFLQNSYQDEWVDISNYTLNYPLKNPTKLKYELLHTLKDFGKEAYPSVKQIKNLLKTEQEKQFIDTTLVQLCEKTIKSIIKATPVCCQIEESTANKISINAKSTFITKKNRTPLKNPKISFIDQDGNPLLFDKMLTKPFVLTFFYTNCINPLKCAATVERLGELQKTLQKARLDNKVNICAMTYDSENDSPSLLKNFGQLYEVAFSDNTKFLTANDHAEKKLFEQLDINVNYGFGSVNQHGIQLFIFDKMGRVAVTYNNQLWTVDDVYNNLMALVKE